MPKINTNKMRRRMTAKARTLEEKVKFALDMAAATALQVAQSLAPGGIPKTIKTRTTSGFVAGVRVYTNHPAALFQENGTRAHEIVPRRGSLLRFEVNGAVRFARRVRHPGTDAVHFMRAGREAGRVVLRDLLLKAIHGA